MADCRVCGETVAAQSAFCSACGSGQGDEPVVIGTAGSVFLDDGSRGQTESSVSRSPVSVPLLVFLALLPVLGFALWAMSTGSEAEQSAPDETNELSEEPEERTRSVNEGASAGRFVPDPDPDGLPDVSVPLTTDQPPVLEIEREDGSTGSFFSVKTGMTLYARATDGLFELDLDAGTMIRHRDARRPLLLVDDHIVFASENSRAVTVSPRSDLTGVRLPVEPGLFVRPQPARTGSFWAFEFNDIANSPSMVEIAVPSLEKLRTASYPVLLNGLLPADPILLSPAAGGVYRLESDGSRTLQQAGHLLAHGYGIALIEQCDDVMVCHKAWYETENFTPVALPVPEGIVNQAQVLGGGRWLSYGGSFGWRPDLLDLQTGEVVESGVERSEGNHDGQFFTSPDGEIVATLDRLSSLTLVHHGTGEEVTINQVRGRDYETALVFAPTLTVEASPE